MRREYRRLPDGAPIVQGQLVYQGLYGRCYGIVYAVRPGPGAGDDWRDEGEAEFDIVWDNGDQYQGLAEAVLRHGNIDIVDEVASADEILDALAHSKDVAAHREQAEQEETDRLCAEMAAEDQRRKALRREDTGDDDLGGGLWDDEEG